MKCICNNILGIFVVLSVLGGGGSVVSAQEDAQSAGAPEVVYKKKTVYDFDDDVVEGDLQRPDGENVMVNQRFKHSSLIEIREHFVPEMIKSAERL